MKHDESKDLRSFTRIGKVDYSNKTLHTSRNATIGIKLWGKIDYLTHYCGWFLVWDGAKGSQIERDVDSAPTLNRKKEVKQAVVKPKRK